MFGGFNSEHFWIGGQRPRAATKASQRGKGRAVPERGASIAQPVVNRGWGYRGVVHERDVSIKEDKKRGEPAGGP